MNFNIFGRPQVAGRAGDFRAYSYYLNFLERPLATTDSGRSDKVGPIEIDMQHKRLYLLQSRTPLTLVLSSASA